MSQDREQNRTTKESISDQPHDSAAIDRITRERGWFRPKDDSAFYPIIQDYLEENIALNDACTRLCAPIDRKISQNKLDDVDFMDLWYSIIHSARCVSFRRLQKQHDIVGLVSAFKTHSIPGNEQYNYLYDSLIDFGIASRKAYNDAPEADRGFQKAEVAAWANFNFFLACVTEKGIKNLSLFAIWALREALETTHQDDKEATAVQRYDAYIPAAAAWVFGMGRTLFLKDEDLTPTDRNQGNPAKGGDLWTGKSEFSKSRWELWKERFAQFAKADDDVSTETKNIARDAIEAMERAQTFERVK